MRCKILVIDDEEDLRKNVKYMLEKDGYDVLLSSDGKKRIQLAKDSKPDLILLDIMMPGMDGSEAMETLKSDNNLKDIPVIFLTDLLSPEDEKRGLSSMNIGTRQCKSIAKLFDRENLLSAIRSILR